jgi:hypothetical protein
MEHHRNHEGREQHIQPSNAIAEVSEELDAAPIGNGSEAAPTVKATERERVRHRIERDLGRTAAGTEGVVRATQDSAITRADLKEAGRIADVMVGDKPRASRNRKRHTRH